MFNNLTRQTLPEQVAENLIDFIAGEGLKPGGRTASATARVRPPFLNKDGHR